ncbi:MAG: M67 family metallopeptidase [Actinomycetota bacterium]|nr:M67 family metallopeptidase [Actinomycetota bacterium]
MIRIPKEFLEKIIAHARRETPNEVCGWLAGEGDEVRRVYPVPNVAGDPQVGFRMDPEIQLSTMREIRDLGLELTGTYHSHPRTPAIPSARDGGLAVYPEAVHLIVSLAAPEPEVRCYRIEEPLNTVEVTFRLTAQLHPGENYCRLVEERVGSSRAGGN